MSVLLNLKWLQSTLRVSPSVELICCSSRRYKHTSKDEHVTEGSIVEKPEEVKYRNPHEMFIEKTIAKDPNEDNVPWWSKGFSDPTTLPLPVKIRKMYYRKYGWTDHLLEKERLKQEAEQLLDPIRHELLGPDLSAAHFILFRGGGVKFSNRNEWIYHDESRKELPLQFDADFVLTGIDMSGLNVRYQALTNFKSLTKVTHLSIANCPRADNWWMDTITGELPSLRHLNIAGCRNITYRGLSALYRLSRLESLNVEGIPYTPFLEMTLFELERLFPELKIFGLDHQEDEKVEEETPSATCEKSN